MEIKVTIAAPELVTAINSLANAISNTSIQPTKATTKTEKSEKPKEAPVEEKKTEKAAPIEDKPVESAQEKEEEKFTAEQVRAKLTALAQGGKQAEVKTLINKFGANRLSEIKPEDYVALMAEAEGL